MNEHPVLLHVAYISLEKKTHIVPTQVRLELSSKDLEGGTLTDTVGPDKTKDLTGSRRRQSMQLERVGGVSVGDLALEVGGQVDDSDGFEGTSGENGRQAVKRQRRRRRQRG